MSEQQVSEVRTSNKEPKANRDQRLFTFKATYAIWLALIMLEGLIALRISLKMIGANPNSGFAILIYNFSNLFLFPFTGLTSSYTSGAIVLEVSSFIAMAVYALLFWGIERVVWVIFYRPREAPVALTQRTSSEQHTE
ncbi:MAG: hypothetical protein AABZ78_17145 [Chloroflexota bacterium]